MPPGCSIQMGCIYTVNYPLSSGNHCTKFGNYQANGPWINERTMIMWRAVDWPWPCDSKSSLCGKHCSKFSNLNKQWNIQILSRQHFFKDSSFYIDLWQCDLNISRGQPLSRASTVPSLATFEQKGQKILSGYIILSKTSSLTMTLSQVTWKSIGVIYSLGAFTASIKFCTLPAKYM